MVNNFFKKEKGLFSRNKEIKMKITPCDDTINRIGMETGNTILTEGRDMGRNPQLEKLD